MKAAHGKQVTRKLSLPREVDHWLAIQHCGASAWVAARVREAMGEELERNKDEVAKSLARAIGVTTTCDACGREHSGIACVLDEDRP